MGVVVPLEEGKKRPGASIEPLVRLTREPMERVNEIILSRAGSDVSMIPEIARHLIDSGGKRLRPMLTIAAAGMCGYDGDGRVKLAASVEFMHTATLLHDDVVDESDLRRGKKAARLVWGNQASVLVGDFLLGQAFKMMVEVGSLEALDDPFQRRGDHRRGRGHAARRGQEHRDHRGRVSCRHQGEDRRPLLGGRRSRPDPRRSAAGPSAPPSARTAPTSASRSSSIDDALDYGGSSSELGKRVGDDFREGKITLPVVLSYRRGTDADRAFWKRVLEDGAIATGDLEQAIALMRSHRAIDDTVERARHFGAVARDALAPFPESAAQSGAARGRRFLHCAGQLSGLRRDAAALRGRPKIAMLAATPSRIDPAENRGPCASRTVFASALAAAAFLTGGTLASAESSAELDVVRCRATLAGSYLAGPQRRQGQGHGRGRGLLRRRAGRRSRQPRADGARAAPADSQTATWTRRSRSQSG